MKIKIKKDYNKIRKLLENEYHLCVTYKDKKSEWKLFKKYDNPNIYFSKDNKVIMTSKTNTYEKLLKYAKDHRKYNLTKILSIQFMISSLCLLVLSILNIFISDVGIRNFLFGANFITLISLTTISIVNRRNFNVEAMNYQEWIKEQDENI